RAVLNAVERLVGGYCSECDRVREELTIAEAQLRDYKERLGKPFLHDAHLSELTGVRGELKGRRSGKIPEPGSEPKCSVSDLATQLKFQMATYTINATPEPVERPSPSQAEEPVTARIRRRVEALCPTTGVG